CLFYAIWFEHWLNGIISTFAERRKLTQDEISKMIRDTNFDAKSTWMLRVLGAKPINKAHWQSMKRINDLRNAFIHYKWKAEADEVERNRERALAAVGKTIRYLRAYENRYVYSNKKRKAS